jgi:hypothetical protein
VQLVEQNVDDRRRIKGKHLETSNPAMMATPSGRRSSEPGPAAIANGTVPRRAAKVVIGMGRKRSRGLEHRAVGSKSMRALLLEREVDQQ